MVEHLGAQCKEPSVANPARIQELQIGRQPCPHRQHDEEDAGPRIGVTGLPETTIKAVAAYEWQSRERRRRRRIDILASLVVGAVLALVGAYFAAVF